MAAKTILLVEDEALIALLETRQLQEVGYAVIHVFSGEKAIEEVDARPGSIDLILMDIDLGAGMDGTSAARRILGRHEIPLLFLSCHQEKALVDKTEEITNYGYVVKNSAFAVLYASIRMALKLFDARKSINQKSMEIEATNEELRVTIVELEETNRELFALEDKFSKAFKLSPDSITITRFSDGVYLDVNEGFTRIMGYARKEVLGRASLPADLEIWVHGEDRRRLVEELGRGAESAQLEAEFRRKNGDIIMGMMSARVIDIDGEKCLLAITRDISERKKFERTLEESELRFRTAFAHAPVGFCLTAPDGRFQMVNEAFCDMTGWTMGELMATDFAGLTHPDDLARSQEVRSLLLSGERDHARFTKRYVHKDGHAIWVDISISIMRARDGKPPYFIVHALDITEQRNREAELAESEQRYHDLLNSIAEGFCHQDEDEVFRFANPAADAIFGVEPGGLLGRRVLDFLDEEGRAIEASETEIRRQGGSSVFVTPIVPAGGGRKWLRIKASPVQDSSGRFIGSSVLFSDVTDELGDKGRA
jgi:PAS domain S-box-containing protein